MLVVGSGTCIGSALGRLWWRPCGRPRGPPRPDRARLDRGGLRGVTQTYFNLPAFLPGVAMGTKIATILPDNPARHPGVPAVQALYALFDGDDGSPAAVIDGTALTYRKTAANSALGSQLLSREDARVLLMVGAGGLAPIWRGRIWRSGRRWRGCWSGTGRPQRAEAMAAALRERRHRRRRGHRPGGGRPRKPTSCPARPRRPSRWWRAHGSSRARISIWSAASRPRCANATTTAVRRARLFIDEASINLDACGDLIDPIRRGVVPRAKVEGDLYDLCRPGLGARPRSRRTSPCSRTAAAGISTCSRPCSSATGCARRRS